MTAQLAERLAGIMRPRTRVRASDWAEDNRQLKPGHTPRPGPWRNDYLPWLAPILDSFADSPWAEGVCWMKASQVGGSELFTSLIGWLYDQAPGPTLYLCTTREQARDFSRNRFVYMIETSPALQQIFLRGKGHGETTFVKPSVAGDLTLAGSNSPTRLISNPQRYVFLDEEDRLPTFPGMGSAREIAETRINEFGTLLRTGLFSWAHPTTPDRGVGHTYLQQSDQRAYVFDCPHCSRTIAPCWEHVVIRDRKPETAEYRCPHCQHVISDPARWAATRQGRFESRLTPEEQRQRRYVGFHVGKLSHPRTSLLSLARKYCACVGESQLQVFFNMQMGVPYVPAKFVLTAESIEKRRDPRNVNRTCPGDTAFVTCGADVQRGVEHVVLYWVAVAWTTRGNAVILDFGRLLGLPALDALLRNFDAPCPGRDPLRMSACGIDHGYKTREVYSFCRQEHGGVPCVPMKHAGEVTREQGTRIDRTIDPLHPEYGQLMRLALCRDYWMDRVMGRYHPEADPEVGGSVVLPAHVTDEFKSHIKSAHRVEVVDRHGHAKLTWAKEKGEPDDYLQAQLQAEVVAVGLGLDRIHESIPQRPRDQDAAIREGFVRRAARSEGRERGYIRGRRR